MRYAEIITESELTEGYLDTLTKALATVAKRPIAIVNNAASALMVIRDVVQDAKMCESVCFLMRKQIIRTMKTLPEVITQKVFSIVPKGYAVADFLGMLILLPSLGFIMTKAKGLAGDTLSDTLQNIVGKLADLKTIASGLLTAGAQGIFGVFQMLGMADELLFRVLNGIHEKMKATA